MRDRKVSVGLPKAWESASHISDMPPLALVEVSIPLVEQVHSRNPPIITKIWLRIDSFVTIQHPLPKYLKVWHLGFLEE